MRSSPSVQASRWQSGTLQQVWQSEDLGCIEDSMAGHCLYMLSLGFRRQVKQSVLQLQGNAARRPDAKLLIKRDDWLTFTYVQTTKT